MSPGPRQRVVGLLRASGVRGWWSGALAAGVLAAALAAPAGAAAAAPHERVTGSVQPWRASARDTPTQVIDAQTDPQAAGDALNNGCADLSNCQWKATSPISDGYGPPKIIGDALYNCSDPQTEPDAYAETAVGFSTEQEESTSISEDVSVEIGGGFLGFEKVSADFEVFSKQAESFSTAVTVTSSVSVPPGWEGYNTYEVLTASVTGDAYITNGINGLIEVTGIDLSFPGYQNPSTSSDSQVKYILQRKPMTDDDYAAHCAPINGLGALRQARSSRFALTSCHATPTAGRGRLSSASAADTHCASRTVKGDQPPAISDGDVTLTQVGRIYATGTDRSGSIRLSERQPIRAGRYTLTITQHKGSSGHGRRRAVTSLATTTPITIS